MHDQPVPLEGLHNDRQRALSFGSIAQRYDRFRSGYPDQLVDDLLSDRPQNALDVGCGTGKSAVALAARGVQVLGVDPDARMAAFARGHGIAVEVSTFEEWTDRGRRFDLITSGHAWHWIDPKPGLAKAARLLRPRGTIARFWNYHTVDPQVLVLLEAIYRKLAPELPVIGRPPDESRDAPDPFAAHPAFSDPDRRTYRWTRHMSAEEWSGLIGTFGDHIRLGEHRLATLQHAVHEAIDSLGGQIDVHGGTYLVRAKRTAD